MGLITSDLARVIIGNVDYDFNCDLYIELITLKFIVALDKVQIGALPVFYRNISKLDHNN